MTPETWRRIKEVFAAARERPPAERASFLDKACGGDASLRAEVESLLAADDADTLLETTTSQTYAELRAALAERYRLERELGRGGMATVFLAHDLKHDRPVALKVLHPELAAVLGTERFKSEIKLAARLQHPHILSVHDSGESAGQLWFTMPFVEGESLRDRLTREKQLTVEDARHITREAALALEYAHRHGVIHRDIKPENLLLTTDGTTLVADFGIARALGGTEQSLTGTGIAIGTPAYMSPEQASGARDVDARTDVYALGCVLFEMLAGEPPYTGPTPQAIMARALTERPRPIHPMRAEVPEALDAVIARAMSPTAADRYASATEFARALELDFAGLASPRLQRRRRMIGVAAAAAALVLVAAGTWAALSLRAPRRDSDDPIDPRHVVAVLPFLNLSGDTSQNYFAAGITEEINGQISRIAALRVMGRGATAAYQQAPDRLQRLAAELGVGSVIEGTTRLAGQQVRIGVSLTDTRSGQTVWSEQYDRDLRNVFAVQGDVALQVAAALEATLTPAEARRVGRRGTQDPDVYELYLRSRQLRFTSAAQNQAGIELLQQVLRKDSSFAAAWANLAQRHYFARVLGGAGGATLSDSGLAAANRAVALDSGLPDAHFARGDLLLSLGQVEAARLAYLKVLELDPNHGGAMMDLSLLEILDGRYGESLYWAMRALLVFPNSSNSYYHAAWPLIFLGDDGASERFLVAAIRRFPDAVRLEMQFAALDFHRGRDAAALERVRRLIAAHPDDQQPRLVLANLVVLMGAPDAEAVLDPMYRADPQGTGWIVYQSYRALYALVLARRGLRDSALALWSAALAAAEQSIRDGNQQFGPRLEIAGIHAVRGDTAAALEWLERAYQAGWREARVIARDPFFDVLRGNPRFRGIVARAEADVAAMRRRAEQAHPALFRKAS